MKYDKWVYTSNRKQKTRNQHRSDACLAEWVNLSIYNKYKFFYFPSSRGSKRDQLRRLNQQSQPTLNVRWQSTNFLSWQETNKFVRATRPTKQIRIPNALSLPSHTLLPSFIQTSISHLLSSYVWLLQPQGRRSRWYELRLWHTEREGAVSMTLFNLISWFGV